MSNFTPLPSLTRDGVVFTISIDSIDHECVISRESLVNLSLFKNIDASDADTMDLYHAFEKTIHAMTRALVACDAAGRPSLQCQQDTPPRPCQAQATRSAATGRGYPFGNAAPPR